eukprot:3184196-Amphidinium_carterae.1
MATRKRCTIGAPSLQHGQYAKFRETSKTPQHIESHACFTYAFLEYLRSVSSTMRAQVKTTLNTKVLKKIGFQIHAQDVEEVIKASPGAIERVLKVEWHLMRTRICIECVPVQS